MATREERERALILAAFEVGAHEGSEDYPLPADDDADQHIRGVLAAVDRTHPPEPDAREERDTPPVDAGVRADPRDIEHHIAEEREARDEADALVARLVAVKDPGTWLRRVVAAGVLLADVMPDGIGELAIADEVLSRFGPPPSSETSERAAAIEECALVCDAGDCYLASDAAARIRALASPLPRVEAEPVPVDAHGWCSRCGGNGIEPGASEQMPDGEWRHERCTACDGSATGPCHPSATWSLLHPLKAATPEQPIGVVERIVEELRADAGKYAHGAARAGAKDNLEADLKGQGAAEALRIVADRIEREHGITAAREGGAK